MVPLTIPGQAGAGGEQRPVTEEPGDRPRFPLMVVGPVFVAVEPAKTVKLAAVPRMSARAQGTASDRTAINNK